VEREERERLEKEQRARKIAQQRYHVESVPGWPSFGELGELHRCARPWDAEEERRFKDIKRAAEVMAKGTRTAALAGLAELSRRGLWDEDACRLCRDLSWSDDAVNAGWLRWLRWRAGEAV
jgi:hypothetical protein